MQGLRFGTVRYPGLYGSDTRDTVRHQGHQADLITLMDIKPTGARMFKPDSVLVTDEDLSTDDLQRLREILAKSTLVKESNEETDEFVGGPGSFNITLNNAQWKFRERMPGIQQKQGKVATFVLENPIMDDQGQVLFKPGLYRIIGDAVDELRTFVDASEPWINPSKRSDIRYMRMEQGIHYLA
jgi:hypothetical protein